MKKRGKKGKSLAGELFSWVLYLFIIIAVTFLLVHYVGEQREVTGTSMYPNLEDGDHLIVNKLTYQFAGPKRFDVVVFPFHYQEDTYYIKRIIGLPGETVQITGGLIYINGVQLSEPFSFDEIQQPGLAAEPITLGEDEYFVMGDNRNNSSDSREPSVGNIKKSELIGKAWLRIWPFSSFGLVK